MTQRPDSTDASSSVDAPSGSGALTATPDGTITSASEAAARLFGYRVDELVGRELKSLMAPLRPGDEHAAFARLRRGVGIGPLNTLGKTRGGESIDVSVSLRPLFGQGGTVDGIAVITRRVGPDELATEGLARLAAIVDSSDDAIIGKTLDGIITSWNQGAERMFGYRAPEAIGRSIDLIVPPERVDEERHVLASIRRGQSVSHFATTRIRKDGTRLGISLSVSPIRDDSGRVVGASKIARDITDRTELEETRARIAAIVDGSFDAIVSKTLQGVITSWNPAAERLFGHSAAEAIGASIHLIIPDDRREEEEAVLASVRRGEVVEPFETVRLRKDGSRVHVSLTVSPVKDGAGKTIGASKIARDIGERIHADQERARLLHEMQESNRAKDEFLAMLGHELRNPLGAMMSALELLGQRGTPEPSGVRAREIAGRQGRHLAKLVDDLLDVGRVMTGKITIDSEPIDLGEAVAAHIAALRSTGRLERHAVTVETASAIVCADPVRLEQIVANLVGNALRYTPAGGHVRVLVTRDGGQASLIVEDDGVGISSELLPHVFDLFVQSERRLERSQGGLGIGLTLVRRLSELQGGSVEAASEGLGRGSRFVVRFPVFAGRTAAASRLEGSASVARPRRILIVEDNEDAREMLRILLEREGHEVHEAADGRKGVDEAVRLRPDVALVDVGLPVLDGYEAARAIRAEVGEDVLLVALTGYGSTEDRRRAMHAGFDVHLRKPVDLRELRGILEKPDAHRATV